MAQFFKAKPNRTKQLSAKLNLNVTQLDHLGAGIAEYQGKVVFIPGALPEEEVTVQLVEQKKKYAHAKLISIDVPSTARIQPVCEYFQQCGGCDLQHLSIEEQRQHKQKTLSNLMHKAIGTQVSTELVIAGSEWGYRRRARLAIWFDKKAKVLALGFRAQSSSNVIGVKHCAVLVTSLSELIEPFAELLNRLACRTSLGHLELVHADNGVYALLRITKSLNETDRNELRSFAAEKQITLLLQDDKGQFENVAASNSCNHGEWRNSPYYQLGNSIQLAFEPGNFIQVNSEVNQAMVIQAIAWLAPQPDERVLDLFCGMGNFSLPLSLHVAEVIGVEGVPSMVEQATINAQNNGITNTSFYHADLSSDLSKAPWLGKIDKILLDPARAGALEVLEQLGTMKPQSVVYVSCNPASLARDAQVLIQQGYQLMQLGLIDMFPQTHHIEAIALFERK